jgi:asparagine synthase (glutamine-hydrolysing)
MWPDIADPQSALPGFLATGGNALERAFSRAPSVSTTMCGPATLAHWGLSTLTPDAVTLALTRVMRTERGSVTPDVVAAAMRDEPTKLTQLLPPFAAVRGDDGGITMVADSMGFRQLYHGTDSAPNCRLLSTSALLAGWAASGELDHTAIAVQSLLGWQLGQRTLFRGIQKLAPSAVARLDAGGLHVSAPERVRQPELSLDEAVTLAAALLRRSLESLLDDHPDAVLQLTGGQDSRILLSAIPVARRRGLRAMTLGVPGGGDVAVAAALAQRYGLRHEVHGLAGLEELSPSEAWERTHAAAMWLDGMSDPIALAALTVAERSFDQGVRISGLGGEIARGFYYVGRVRDRPVTRADAEHLASWRMFVNEAVEPGLLKSDFAAWAREAANGEVYGALSAGASEWFRAADDLYLRHRMQRWAGLTDTAIAYQRIVINPMLDPQFLDIAARLVPRDKAQSRFLALLQMELDPELGRIPLEARPAPIVYANTSAWHAASLAANTGKRLVRKVMQRLGSGNRPPAGGAVLAANVVEHWRENPSILKVASRCDFVRTEWLDQLLEGRIQPRPSSVAFVANLLTAVSRAS